VVGIGGLGHLALKIANKWGCIVTAFTSKASKVDQIKALGAHHVIDTKADPELKTAANSQDMILLCGNGADVNWKGYINALKCTGKLLILGLSGMGDVSISPVQLLASQKMIAGSNAGGLIHYVKMIDFCVQHGIMPQNEKFAFDDINKALAAVKAGTLRYRAVVVHSLNKK